MTKKNTEPQQEPEQEDVATEETPETDSDDQELAAAQAALEAEEKGDEPADKGEPEPKTEAEGEEDEPDEDEKPSKATPMIPKVRFDEKIAENADLSAQIQYLNAKVEAFERMVSNPKATEEQKEKAAEQVVDAEQQARDAIEEKLIKAAEQYDDNEITMAQFKRIEMEAQRELSKMDREGLVKEIAGSQPKRGLDAFSKFMIETLEEKHPYTTVITNNRHWDILKHEAMGQLADEGIAYAPEDQEWDMMWRTRMAELSDHYGPIWVPDAKFESGSESSTTTEGKPQDKTSMAKAREKKLQAAEKFPPDTAKLGRAGTPTDVPTEAALMAMTDEEIENLPAAVRAKLQSQT
jgi:hypothetical protein